MLSLPCQNISVIMRREKLLKKDGKLLKKTSENLKPGWLIAPGKKLPVGLPPLEAMACGTPVVCSNVSSLPEVVGDAAILVNPENVFDIARGISDMLLDEEVRARMIRRGREQAARFSWNWTARQVLEIYQDVISQS